MADRRAPTFLLQNRAFFASTNFIPNLLQSLNNIFQYSPFTPEHAKTLSPDLQKRTTNEVLGE